ncbi:MAG: phosphoribosylformylglycinamidine synthase subunit PurL [Solirubrobacteraceae bacterium]|nr:phosphoribosylformylglycinamidine synthase subunit PurL [Solirubrobacteraceae bacterium]
MTPPSSPPAAAAPPGRARAIELGLTGGEYDLVAVRLGGREPNEVELAMFSLMWSEHCAYKHSKPLLRTLPTDGPRLVLGPGENAGAVDVGGGLVCAFKVESHNHPSAVEPFQGAATGVGGILRDVFAIGARPIAILDSLRFGEPGPGPASRRTRYLLERAVAGIGHYGNSIGVPTVGGEVYFEAPYEQNCLINAMAIGLIARDRLIRSAAEGPGNVLVLFGAATGRDGIGGASVLASAELGEDDASKRPSVQVGDPFAEKKLMECSLELLDRGLLVALQDLGAAGLTSAAAEMASKGELGVDIDIARIPLREAGMRPFEIMVSESQERMLCVAAPDRVDEVIAVCARWETAATPIGAVTDSGLVRILDGERTVGEMPVRALVDDCPVYTLEPAAPERQIYPRPRRTLTSEDPTDVLLALLASPNIADRRPVFEQYDCLVQSRTVRRPAEADAAVLMLPARDGVTPAIAAAIDGNGRRVACDPYHGTIEAVLECAANLACVGAEPLGLTNCLNFGNPEKPHVAWQLTESVRGLGDACRALGIPVVGGNVSLYNEAGDGPIYPTPVVGMVGELPDAARAGRMGFAAAGDLIAVAGPFAPAIPGSELARLGGAELPLGLPPPDLPGVQAAQGAVRDAVRSGALRSAHDIAEGGLAAALAECCLAGDLGAAVVLQEIAKPMRALFGEGPGGFVVSGSAAALRGLGERTPVRVIGAVGGEALAIEAAEARIVLSLERLRAAHMSLAAMLG